ncbi:hypothetical protein [Nocardioides sp. CER19]|uniref:hypothetical protein n=1 Tax=Nocardioides sp. CER19 TaxID=3038538 RepID=UPI00244BE498|nr:hypothetical protein [Nocardioides sp. CER19]MDH2414342.1 hypothetical protein [Nocardioides sp. CER19]
MDPKQLASQALTKALTFQGPVARKNFERLRRVHPNDSPVQLQRRITKYYLSTVATSGGAMGAAGAVPGGGIPSAAFDVVAFTEASVLYALTLAELHDLHPEDLERRRLLVQTILIGDSAITALNKGVGRAVPFWGFRIVKRIPMSAVNAANKVLGPRFITKYGTKQGVLVLSKQIPLGLGVGVGAGANYLIGRTIAGTAKKVFGPPPATFASEQDAAEDVLEPVWITDENDRGEDDGSVSIEPDQG